MQASFIQKEKQKVAGAGIWWTERGEASKHPSILNSYGSELPTLILAVLCVRFKKFL